MRIGVVQTVNAQPDMTASLRAGLTRLQDAKEAGVDLVVFPELFLGGYYVDQAMVGRASKARAALARLQAAVDQLERLVRGRRARPARRRALRRGRHPAPRARPGRYAKTHLFRAEKELFTPGSSLWTGEIAGWQCGVLVCYEVAFPEVARALALSGARLLIVPAAFGKGARAHLADRHHLARHRKRLLPGGRRPCRHQRRHRVRRPQPHRRPRRGAPGRRRRACRDVDGRAAGRASSTRPAPGAPTRHACLSDRRPELYGALTEPRGESQSRAAPLARRRRPLSGRRLLGRRLRGRRLRGRRLRRRARLRARRTAW